MDFLWGFLFCILCVSEFVRACVRVCAYVVYVCVFKYLFACLCPVTFKHIA